MPGANFKIKPCKLQCFFAVWIVLYNLSYSMPCFFFYTKETVLMCLFFKINVVCHSCKFLKIRKTFF